MPAAPLVQTMQCAVSRGSQGNDAPETGTVALPGGALRLSGLVYRGDAVRDLDIAAMLPEQQGGDGILCPPAPHLCTALLSGGL
jgi:hypothetical protein